MADVNLTAHTRIEVGIVGNDREAFGRFTPSAATCVVQTELSVVDSIQLETEGLQQRQCIAVKNAPSAGHVSFSSITSGAEYTYRARGH